MNDSKPAGQYAVLNPWAEVDPVPLKGLAPRLDTLNGKKIGLFINFKDTATMILTELEKKMREKYPGIDFVWWGDLKVKEPAELEGPRKDKFDEWVNLIDAAVFAVGD